MHTFIADPMAYQELVKQKVMHYKIHVTYPICIWKYLISRGISSCRQERAFLLETIRNARNTITKNVVCIVRASYRKRPSIQKDQLSVK